MDELTYTFDNPADASRYLREIGVLWGAWVVGLAGLLVTDALLLIVWGVVVIAALVYLARPIQRRAERLVPDNKIESSRLEGLFRGGTTRDRAIRDLAYGAEPLRAALSTAGLSERWMTLRQVIIALSLLALIYVLANPIP